jgi:alcohol dehydrogenase (quinone), cytochrome c subunit
MAADAASSINIVLNGSSRIVLGGVPDIYRMPPFLTKLSDQEIAEVVSFIRRGWGNSARAASVKDVAAIRNATDPTGERAVILRMR